MPPRFPNPLMRHAMMEKMKKENQMMKPSRIGQRFGLVQNQDESGKVQMKETTIFVGLNDAETREQKYNTEKYVNTLKSVCRSHHTAFTMDIVEGGYFHEDGQYIEETSLVAQLIDTDPEVVRKIAQELRSLFHQESVLVIENHISGYFVVGESSD